MKRTTSTGFTALISLLLILGSCSKNSNSTSATANPDLQLVTDGLVSPVGVVEAPDSSHRLFVIDEIGKIWIVGANRQKLTNPFMDLSSRMVTLSPNYD